MNSDQRTFRAAARLAAWAAGLALLACSAPPHRLPDDFAGGSSAAEETAPLGGTALAQRKGEMARALRDMVHFHTTLETLNYRGDRKGLRQMRAFMEAYLGLHLDPMLATEWQSRHPELMGLDVNLRLAKADVLIRMRETGRAQRVIDEIRWRFKGREDMLVEYPLGEQSTLEEGLRLLRDGKWRGSS